MIVSLRPERRVSSVSQNWGWGSAGTGLLGRAAYVLAGTLKEVVGAEN
jgi:hypothetical protein